MKPAFQGLDELKAAIARITAKMEALLKPAEVVYTAPYAVYVHEDLEAKHVNGRAKFLEAPAKDLEVRRRMAKAAKEGGCRAAAAVLLEASRPLVPVATGALRDSGRVE